MKYIELITWQKDLIHLHGEKLTPTQWLIGRRSDGLHTAIRFSDTYGRISWSCTCADDVDGCRFKMNEYKHPYRQSRVRIPVTEEQEAKLFAKACGLSGLSVEMATAFILHPSEGYQESENCTIYPRSDSIYYGTDHVKYDKNGARFSFITEYEIFRMHRKKMICNEACANVMLEVWADLLDIIGRKIKPHDLNPAQFELMVRLYFERKTT